jgi:hypothetical protein
VSAAEMRELFGRQRHVSGTFDLVDHGKLLNCGPFGPALAVPTF